MYFAGSVYYSMQFEKFSTQCISFLTGAVRTIVMDMEPHGIRYGGKNLGHDTYVNK